MTIEAPFKVSTCHLHDTMRCIFFLIVQHSLVYSFCCTDHRLQELDLHETYVDVLPAHLSGLPALSCLRIGRVSKRCYLPASFDAGDAGPEHHQVQSCMLILFWHTCILPSGKCVILCVQKATAQQVC